MINDAIRQIRDTVNTAVLIHNIERHGFQWDMVAASLDILGDTQLAIEAYKERQGKVDSDVGHGYLDAYGLFQAIFMQQDALTNLAEGLKLSRVRVHKNPDSAYVRNLRTNQVFWANRRRTRRPGRGNRRQGTVPATFQETAPSDSPTVERRRDISVGLRHDWLA
jgi:hypothetical protein